MTKEERDKLISSNEYVAYEEYFTRKITDNHQLVPWETSYDLAIAELIKRDAEIKELRDYLKGNFFQ